MSWETIRILWAHELRMLTRDRRTIVVAIVLPLVVMPLMIYASREVNEKRRVALEETLYRYSVTGTEAEGVRTLVARGRDAVTAADPADPAIASLRKFRSEEVRAGDAAAALEAKDLEFYLVGLSGSEADALPPDKEIGGAEKDKAEGKPKAESVLADTVRLPGVPMVRIVFHGDRDSSVAGSDRMRDLLVEALRASRGRLLRERGLGADTGAVFEVEEASIAGAAQVTGSQVGRFLTLFVMMFMLTGGSVVAMDIIAGEKERGSLETLLTTAAGRGEIVTAKQLTIMTVAAVITMIQVADILVFVTFKLISLPERFVLVVPPMTIVILLLLFLPVAAFVACVLLLISAYAKTYKEAQLFFFPVFLLFLVPPLVATLPGVTLQSIIALVPLANVSVAVREIMVGRFDWPMIGVVFLAMIAASAWTVRQSARLLSKERLITSSESDAADLTGGPALFPRHVLRWYGIMGAVLIAVTLNVPQLASIRRQLLFNEMVIFTAFPLLMTWRYRLDVREALALRRVHPLVWLGVLLIIPSGCLVGSWVFRLANLVIPVPREMIEQFWALFPKDLPIWQVALLFCVLPGICEEIAFRGTLLHGLRRRFRPAVLAVVVGLIFGLFHMSLYRIVPTAFLGILLTGVALLTGSIYPCMLAHAGNNAFSLWLRYSGYTPSDLPLWIHAVAAPAMLFGFYILYRVRSPYPGLRSGPR